MDFLKISPDGKRVALSSVSGLNDDVWIWDLAGGNMTRLTFEEGNDTWPLWTPDGQRIVYVSARDRQKFNIKHEGSGWYGRYREAWFISSHSAPLGLSKRRYPCCRGRLVLAYAINIVTISLKGDHSPNPLLHESLYRDPAEHFPRWKMDSVCSGG